MLNKKYFQAVRQDLLSYAEKRREVIKAAGDAQQLAKKAIFALQRNDSKLAASLLDQSILLLQGLNKKFKSEPDLFTEGSYRAAIEEYTEAALFAMILTNKPIDKIPGLTIDSDTFVGGLCDVPGELCRYAITCATERKFDAVKKYYTVAEEIIAELVDMDLTGYNRQKFDQAKQALNKLQQIVYEVSLKS